MTATPRPAEPMMSPAPVKTAAEAAALIAHFMDVTEQLIGVVQQETELLRAGSVGAASRLAPSKGDLTRLYVADTLQLRASQAQLAGIAPDTIAALRTRHDSFRSLLQTNLTVLATAHAVSEGIVRGVSGEMARKVTPQTYGSSGRANRPNGNAAAPLAVSRML